VLRPIPIAVSTGNGAFSGSSSNIYNISLMASIVSNHGEEVAENWARGVVSNFARDPQGNDRAQVRAVASGECSLAVVNTYYIARMMTSDDQAEKEAAMAVGVIFPGQEGRGTHVNISGAGVAVNAPNKENAVKFIEYLTEEQAQRYLAEGNNEYPVVEGTPIAPAAASLGDFEEDTLNASELGINQATAVRVFDRAGWQ
jgi:iron(III) transport system substrate-binding protein